MASPQNPSMMGSMASSRVDHAAGAREFRDLFTASYPGVVRTVYYERPDAWVRRVAVRKAQREAARAERRPRLERRAAVAADPVGLRVHDAAVMAAVRSLPPKQRAVMALFYFEDRPMQEIAEIVGCSPATGWVQLHNARRRLATMLAEEVTEDVR